MVATLPPVDLPVVDVAVVLVAVPTVEVTVITAAIIMGHPNLGSWGILGMNDLKVDLPQVLVDPEKLDLDWLPNLEDPVSLTADQGQVLLGILVLVIVHHTDVDQALDRVR